MTVTKEEYTKEFEEFKSDARAKIIVLTDERNQLKQAVQAANADYASASRELESSKQEILLLRKKLEGYSGLEKAVAQIKGGGVDESMVRKLIQEELAKGSPVAGGLGVTESRPTAVLKIAKPRAELDESTIEGKVCVLLLNGKLGARFFYKDLEKALDTEYGAKPRDITIKKALENLVGQYKFLVRALDSKSNQYVYSRREDLPERLRPVVAA